MLFGIALTRAGYGQPSLSRILLPVVWGAESGPKSFVWLHLFVNSSVFADGLLVGQEGESQVLNLARVLCAASRGLLM